MKSREVRLKSRPAGFPEPGNFEVAEVEVPDPKDGEILVRNLWMSVDPYMRGRMYDRESYVAPFRIGSPLEGGAIGRVEASKNPAFGEGDLVSHMLGWREAFVSDGSGMMMKVDGEAVPPQAYLGVAGMPGLTAYVGLLRIGQPKEGETVFVSAAAGAVGSVVCQIAKLRGCRVVGSAGGERKVGWLRETCGVDAAIDYKATDDLLAAVREACPKGIDVYFENVGGRHLEVALELANPHARFPMCGMIELYNVGENPPPGPRNLIWVVGRSIRMEGFIVSNHFDMMAEFQRDMVRWIGEGRVRWEETVQEGIGKAPEAFLGLFRGENLGKMLVRLAD